MPIPARKDEYRPEVGEVISSIFDDTRIEGYLHSLAEAVLDGAPAEQAKAKDTFYTLFSQMVRKHEDRLIGGFGA